MMNTKSVGVLIKTHRLDNNLTQAKLAELVDINTTYLGRLESGEREGSIDVILRIATALGITPAYEIFAPLVPDVKPAQQDILDLADLPIEDRNSIKRQVELIRLEAKMKNLSKKDEEKMERSRRHAHEVIERKDREYGFLVDNGNEDNDDTTEKTANKSLKETKQR